MEPRLLEKDKVSSVRFSSSTLSGGSVVLMGPGIGVGVFWLSGRKIVLKPRPVQVPVKAARGPRLGASVGAVTAAAVAIASETPLIEKFAGFDSASTRCVRSAMGTSFQFVRK
jgi:hypothetical protein